MSKNGEKVQKILQLLGEIEFLSKELEDIDEESERSINQYISKLALTFGNILNSSDRRNSNEV